ncbi:hypothetical protein LA303_10375 [Candidatus Sulfidibacterium hydrothermale]|uniref:SLC13 family permease n=1 Tax=Candidatus Sulfidibacterium hydrothermale TaxID=2875962 RepID=UPI001F0AF7F1|nr:SLC13 family permease [Candidatus Sulfidibacterium hydrothermale]UBM61810.1 hypothetical protein LA303_10375 [Candidatus Sulfidibacterium hydrothermale]
MEQSAGKSENKGILFLKDNVIFLPFLALLLLFMMVWPQKITDYPRFVDWQTVGNLTGLLIVVTGIKESGFIGRFSKGFLIKTGTERGLAFALVALSGLLSMVLTNDIALFITVPLTLGFRDVIENDVKKLIIFQALAVNTGSALTPVGNPQNLFLWNHWGIEFFAFIGKMFPLFVVMAVILALFVWKAFPSKALTFHSQPRKKEVRTRLFMVSAIGLVAFIVAIEMEVARYALLAILIFYLLLYRKVFIKTDWMLLLLFVVMFIDFHLLSQVSWVIKGMAHFKMAVPSGAFFSSLFSSQIMSNVPAAIFISKFSHQWQAIAYGVNVGGNGLVIASLANIIALRFVKQRSVWADFHKYSLFYLAVTATVVFLLFFF